jgi:hypothetical protein
MGKKVCRVRSRVPARGLWPVHELAKGREYDLNHRAESILREMAFVYHLTSRVRTAMTRDAEARSGPAEAGPGRAMLGRH